jgi:GNAT superfamily N-acetyltransferase
MARAPHALLFYSLQLNSGVSAQQAPRLGERLFTIAQPFTSLATLPPFPSLLPPGVVAKRLDSTHEDAVTAFCRQCSVFFTLVAGESNARHTARHLLESRPESVDPTHKYVIGFERAGTLIAIADLLEGYPDATDWYVGLLLLAPDERGRGLGTLLWSAVEQWIRAQGGRHARLIVQEQNPDGAQFWRAIGFTANGTVTQSLQAQTNLCWCFERPLADLTQQADVP